MPKRVQPDDIIDPVRSRLAALAASPATPTATLVAEPKPPTPTPREKRGGQENGTSRKRPVRAGVPRILTVNRKIMVTPEEAERIEDSTSAISASFGSKVTYSQVSRAVWSILAGAEDAIRAGSRRSPNLRVPSKGDHVGMAEYEEALADFLATALKRP